MTLVEGGGVFGGCQAVEQKLDGTELEYASMGSPLGGIANATGISGLRLGPRRMAISRRSAMWKRLMVVLDGTKCAKDAVAWGGEWAKSHGGELIGLAVIDVERITGGEAVPLGGMAYKEERDQMRVDHARAVRRVMIEKFRERLTATGLTARVIEAEGAMVEVVAREAQRCDAIVVDWPSRDEPEVGGLTAVQLADLVKHSPCPVIVVPEVERIPADALIAFDGSAQAARAVAAFAQSGLAVGRTVRVIGVGDDREAVARTNERAIELLQAHGIAAKSDIVESSGPAEALRSELLSRPAALLVMGAYGQRTWREFLFGSVTESMLTNRMGPILLAH